MNIIRLYENSKNPDISRLKSFPPYDQYTNDNRVDNANTLIAYYATSPAGTPSHDIKNLETSFINEAGPVAIGYYSCPALVLPPLNSEDVNLSCSPVTFQEIEILVYGQLPSNFQPGTISDTDYNTFKNNLDILVTTGNYSRQLADNLLKWTKNQLDPSGLQNLRLAAHQRQLFENFITKGFSLDMFVRSKSNPAEAEAYKKSLRESVGNSSLSANLRALLSKIEGSGKDVRTEKPLVNELAAQLDLLKTNACPADKSITCDPLTKEEFEELIGRPAPQTGDQTFVIWLDQKVTSGEFSQTFADRLSGWVLNDLEPTGHQSLKLALEQKRIFKGIPSSFSLGKFLRANIADKTKDPKLDLGSKMGTQDLVPYLNALRTNKNVVYQEPANDPKILEDLIMKLSALRLKDSCEASLPARNHVQVTVDPKEISCAPITNEELQYVLGDELPSDFKPDAQKQVSLKAEIDKGLGEKLYSPLIHDLLIKWSLGTLTSQDHQILRLAAEQVKFLGTDAPKNILKGDDLQTRLRANPGKLTNEEINNIFSDKLGTMEYGQSLQTYLDANYKPKNDSENSALDLIYSTLGAFKLNACAAEVPSEPQKTETPNGTERSNTDRKEGGVCKGVDKLGNPLLDKNGNQRMGHWRKKKASAPAPSSMPPVSPPNPDAEATLPVILDNKGLMGLVDFTDLKATKNPDGTFVVEGMVTIKTEKSVGTPSLRIDGLGSEGASNCIASQSKRTDGMCIISFNNYIIFDRSTGTGTIFKTPSFNLLPNVLKIEVQTESPDAG